MESWSQWSIELGQLVRKKDGGIRICADFKIESEPLFTDQNLPAPNYRWKFSPHWHRMSDFFMLDLAHAYKQIVVALDSRPFYIHCYRRLPFGIATAPAIWQKAMSVVLQGCKGVVYFIDILVTGKTRVEYKQNLQSVFCCLQQFGLHVKLSKCQIFQDFVTYLGHKITYEGIQLREERISSERNTYPTEQNWIEVIFRYNSKNFVMSGLAPPLPASEEGYQEGMA